MFTKLRTEEAIDELLNNEGKKKCDRAVPVEWHSSGPFEHQRSITKTSKQFHGKEYAFKFLPFKSVF